MRTTSSLTVTVALWTAVTVALHAGADDASWLQQRGASALTAGSESFPKAERFLVPVLGGIPGRFGALWVAELWVRNSSDHDLLFGSGNLFTVLPPGYPQFVYRATGRISKRAERGAIYVVEKAFADEVHLSLRIADVNRRPVSQGTEVPIVRERDWLSRPVELLDIPTDSAVRQTLRVYETEGTNETAVRVIVYPLRENEPVAEAVLEPRGGVRLFPRFESGAPAYAEIADLVERFPQIVVHDRLRVRIEPLTPGMRFWAFVTITDNMTQHVTVVTPQ
jgi:hypothetical protein